jgi:Coenzyme PQQ synthesis protein D (PqqD)
MNDSNSGQPPAVAVTQPARSPRRRADVQARGLEGEMVLLDVARQLIHQLNPTASFIWTRCDGDRSLAEIAAQVADMFGVDPETAIRDVTKTVAHFRALQLLEAGDEQAPCSPST